MKIIAASDSESIQLNTFKYKKSVDLCSRSLITVTDDINGLKATCLNLCCNQISSLPKSFGSFAGNLKVLSLSNNKIKLLPEQLFNCVQLVELNVSINKITKISSSLGKLVNVKQLNIANNSLGCLPQEIGRCKNLEILNVSNNCLYTIPAEFSYLQNVKSVLLEGNPLHTIVPSTNLPALSLRELAARQIRNFKISTDKLPLHLQDYISSGKKCSHCSRHFFETVYRRGRMIYRGGQEFPIQYNLCESHWSTEKERIKSLFQPISSHGLSSMDQSSLLIRTSSSMSDLNSPSSRTNRNGLAIKKSLWVSFGIYK